MIDNRPGSGFQVLRSWQFESPDGRRYEVVLVAATLLRVRPGPIPKRYIVAYGSPIARTSGWQADNVIGEYDDYGEAQSAAENWIRVATTGTREDLAPHPACHRDFSLS